VKLSPLSRPESPAVFFNVKNYILDTNVLLHDPNSILNFTDNQVLIPIEVIEEIDRFKRESSELGQNARQVSRMLDGFRGEGSLSEGVKLPNGGQLQIAFYKNGNGNGAGESHILAESVPTLPPSRPFVPKNIELPLHRRVDRGKEGVAGDPSP